MRVYLDVVILINFIFDFLSLLTVSIILKRNTKIFRLIFGSLTGLISIITMFIRFSSIELILFKLILSIIINLVTFSFHDIRYFFTDLYYFYIIEIILGGFIYLVRDNLNNNILIYILLSLIFIILFIKNIKNLKNNYNKYLRIKLDINNKTYNFNAFLDTGNKLVDPILKLPVIIINNDLLKLNGNIFVPYKTVKEESILECIKGNNLYVNNKKINKKFLIGLSNNINIDGVDAIFNEKLMEGI